MDAVELERNISELEEKLDRVRALYEQYFCGIEKLEPQVPRKDLDRRIVILRKEQIRNTAMRFKFNTIVQRYNTMQQHWNRILREIENGTYKRDLARAAARFGIDEALTAVGRKRAERMAAGLQAQLERQGRKQPKKTTEEEYEEVGDDDVEAVEDDFDDDAPTPPPQVDAGVARHPGYQQQDWQGYQAAQQQDPNAWQAAQPWPPQYPQAAPSYPSPGEQPNYGAPPAPAAQYGAPSMPPDPFAPLPSRATRATGPMNPRSIPPPSVPPPSFPSPPGVQAWPPSSPAPASTSQPGKDRKAGGLRLGGGPSRKASADALNRIASSLGEGDEGQHARATTQHVAGGGLDPTAQPPQVATRPEARKPLLSSPIDFSDLPPEPEPPPAPRQSAPDGALGLRPPTGQHTAGPRERLPSKPGLAPPPRSPFGGVAGARAVASAPAVASATPPETKLEAKGADSTRSGARPAESPVAQPATPPPRDGLTSNDPPRRAQVPAAARPAVREGGRDDLSEGRLREIYSQYVQSRRERNESTAGITFDKLADSLRNQAEKLKTKHASKRVDYEVIVKDGKTQIKPIVR
ncbi:MAG: hypothetical protein HOW73_25940 [Polyangiaceae bacterium]|nr:hypothetical protein [Polyangiaceae bacterium]